MVLYSNIFHVLTCFNISKYFLYFDQIPNFLKIPLTNQAFTQLDNYNKAKSEVAGSCAQP